MGIISLVAGEVLGGLGSVAGGVSKMQDVRSGIEGASKQVLMSWIGGDEKAFEQKVQTQLLPAVADFISSLSGLGSVTHKAMDTLHAADSKAKGLVSKLTDEFSKI